jgi:hypothetical protein
MANDFRRAPRREDVATEYVIEVLDGIRKRLKAGAQGPGVTLDADECSKVLGALVDPSFPNSRPPSDGIRETFIAIYCARLEKSMPLKNAVIDTALKFNCSVSTVRAALKAARK